MRLVDRFVVKYNVVKYNGNDPELFRGLMASVMHFTVVFPK